jgi:hypothetical protein
MLHGPEDYRERPAFRLTLKLGYNIIMPSCLGSEPRASGRRYLVRFADFRGIQLCRSTHSNPKGK